MTQRGLALGLNLPPVPNEYGLFWCCADCLHITKGGISISWTPPDYRTGYCRHCRRDYEFTSDWGLVELGLEEATE